MSYYAIQDGNDLTKYVKRYNPFKHTFDLTAVVAEVKEWTDTAVAQAACDDVSAARFHVVASPKPH